MPNTSDSVASKSGSYLMKAAAKGRYRCFIPLRINQLALTCSVIFRFRPGVSFHEVQQMLKLSEMAVESLFGPERLWLQCRTVVESNKRTIALDGGTEAGAVLALIFMGYLAREFGWNTFDVEDGQ